MASKRNESKKTHDATKSPAMWDDWDFVITSEGFEGVLENLSGALSAYEAKLYNVLGAIAAMAIHLRDHPKLWAAFCGHKFWKEVAGGTPKRDQYEHSLRYVMRFSIGPTRKDSQNASRYVKAIAPLVESGVKPAELPARIAEEGGIVKLIRKWKIRDDEGDEDDESEGDDDQVEGGPEDDDLFAEGVGTTDAPASKRRKPPRPSTARGGSAKASKPAITRNASGGSSKDRVYLPAKLLVSKKDRDDILGSDPVERKLLFVTTLLAIEDGEIVAKVDRWENLETQEEARARLAP